jgi:hypothetical protein
MFIALQNQLRMNMVEALIITKKTGARVSS